MSDHVSRYAEVRRVLVITLVLNLAVAVAKLVIGQATNMLSMVADGYHSLLDASSNVIGLVAIYFAYKPADEDHQYGHRKYEAVSAMAISLALFAAAYNILQEAYSRFLDPSVVPEVRAISFAVMLTTLVINYGVSTYEEREGRRLKSQLLLSDSAHTRSDVYATTAVLISLVATHFGLAWFDPIASLAIALIILRIGYHIVRDGLSVISDGIAIDPARVHEIVIAIDGVADCDDVRSRGTDDHVFMDLVCFVAGSMSMTDAHGLADRIEQQIYAALPQVKDIVVHLAPIEERHRHRRGHHQRFA